jgi:hypothetical protein
MGVELVTDKTCKTTRKQVHPAKDGRNRGSRLSGQSKLFLEVQGGVVVHCQLHAEAACVMDEKKPRIEVECSTVEGSGGMSSE